MFTRNDNAALGGSLQATVKVSRHALDLAFGKPNPNAYYDPEKGYDGEEYIFVDADGHVVNLYARWGCWRIGAENNELADQFGKWLSTQINRSSYFSYQLMSPVQAVANVRMHAMIESTLQEKL